MPCSGDLWTLKTNDLEPQLKISYLKKMREEIIMIERRAFPQ